jgi:type I restriction enzyme S subunit
MSHGQETRPGWRSAILQDLVFFQRGYDITKAEQEPGDIPVVSSSGINSYHSEFKVEGPGVVIGRKGSLGTVHYVEGPYWPHDTTLWSKDIKGNHARFVYYFLHTLGLDHYDVGNANPTLNRNHIHGLDITIPDYRIQERIASTLSTYDDLIENNRRRIQLLEESARLLYREWFVRLRFPGHEHVKIIDGVPEGWDKSSLGDLVNIRKGKNITKDTANEGEVPVVAGGLTPAYFHDTSNAIAPVITISASGANAGYVNIYHEDIWASDCSYISKEATDYPYSYYRFLPSKQNEIFSLQRGAAQPHVYPKDLMRISVIHPPNKVIRLFEEIVTNQFILISNLIKQNKSLTKARDLLLPRLMNGEVAV